MVKMENTVHVLSGGLSCRNRIFIFMYLADAFIQSDLQCIQAIHFSLGIEPTTFCAADTMLYHWATGTQIDISIYRYFPDI